jgi:uncharacterized protein
MDRLRSFVVASVILGLLATASPAAAAPPPDQPPAFEVRESVGQLSVTGLEPGATVEVLRPVGRAGRGGRVLQRSTADEMGSTLFRELEPGSGYGVRVGRSVVRDLVVESAESSLPDQSHYDDQTLTEGFQYIETRDGTLLSVNVVLPGPVEDGPYPTVVEYSGYDPSNPLAGLGGLGGGIDPTPLCDTLPILCKAPAEPGSLLAGLMGHAVVGVNVRGTGCSGGAYDFFEELQVLDGYDVIETVAAQDWVAGNRVGMVGLSYPGISQLFVARSQPPSLAAITPLSVYGDTGTGVLRPGGILNTGFATSWADQVLANARPSGTSWVRRVIAEGDTTCEANQALRLQNVDAHEKAIANPYYTDEVAGPLDIRRFAGDIEVPVFLASAWQDEQTGPSFADLLDRFDAAPVTRFTLYNGLHADGFAPQVLSEWAAFLDLYVADEVPSIPPEVRFLTPVFTQSLFGGPVPLPPDRWTDVATADEARARFESEPPVRVIFDSGAGAEPGLPVGAYERSFDAWPVPSVTPQRWWLTPEGQLAPTAPPGAPTAVGVEHDPDVGQTTYWSGGSSAIWRALPAFDWQPAATGDHAAFETPPLTAPLTMLGTGSVDLWVRSSAADADLEVIISEVRPDGQEMLVQSGRLRASYRALEPDSTELHPLQLGREEDIAPLPSGEWTQVRVLVPAFGHAFRPGSRVRLTVNTPGGDQPTWSYQLLDLPPGTQHLLGTGGDAASSVVLPVVAGATVPTALPPCPSLRGQPCRPVPAIDNVVVPVPPPSVDARGRCAGTDAATGTRVDSRPAPDAVLRHCLRLNQIQVLGTHNSYKQAIAPQLLAALRAFDPDLAASLEYDHPPLDHQLSAQGIRQIELDVFADPDGGTYAGRVGLDLVGLPNDPPPEILEPGFKVLHVQDLDFESSCLTFVECLRQVRAWSRANDGHLPIAVLVELKDAPIPDPGFGFVVPPPIGAAELDALDAEIRSVFDDDDVITPDDVRGDHATLEAAVLDGGWPTLAQAQGKVLFLMDNGGAHRATYREGRPSLEGRMLFTNSEPGSADAAFVKVNSPVGNEARIQELVAAGYVVRTRADTPTVQARTGDTTQRDAALRSSAQWVSTDYPVPGSSPFSDYFATIPDGSPARCNPVNTGPRCRNEALEPG